MKSIKKISLALFIAVFCLITVAVIATKMDPSNSRDIIETVPEPPVTVTEEKTGTDDAKHPEKENEYPAENTADAIPTPEPTPERAGNPFLDINAEPCNIVKFGKFEQNDDGGEGEPLEWYVLANEDEKMFLLCKNSIECMPMKDSDSKWEESQWRIWLNNEFFNEAFSEYEKDWIELTEVEAVRNPTFTDVDPGNNTEDYVFLISINDYYDYMEGHEEYKFCEPTQHAINNNAYININNRNGLWIMRTPGAYDTMWIVDNIYTGEPAIEGANVANGYTDKGIRPAMWVSKYEK